MRKSIICLLILIFISACDQPEDTPDLGIKGFQVLRRADVQVDKQARSSIDGHVQLSMDTSYVQCSLLFYNKKGQIFLPNPDSVNLEWRLTPADTSMLDLDVVVLSSNKWKFGAKSKTAGDTDFRFSIIVDGQESFRSPKIPVNIRPTL